MADAIIEVKDVEFRYEGAEEEAVAGVSLRVERGEFVAVLGRNGSGKSTLAKLLNALNIPQKGEIWIDGVAAHEEANSLEVRKKCGMVFQNPDNQIVATVVEEDCAFGLENLGVPPEEIRRRVDEALRVVGMRDYAEARRTCSPAARSSVWPSPACWPCGRRSSSLTNPPPCSTLRAARGVFRGGGTQPPRWHHHCLDHAFYGRGPARGAACW